MTEFEPAGPRIATSEADWWRARRTLVECWGRGRPGSVWDVRRWDGHRFHRADTDLAALPAPIGLWERGDRVVAVAVTEGPGEIHLQLCGGGERLVPEMLDWGLRHLRSPDRPAAETFVFDDDDRRARLVAAAGFRATREREVIRSGSPAPARRIPAPSGYRIRSLVERRPGDDAETAALLNAAFGRTVHTASELANFRSKSPSFRPDLELLADAAGGGVVAMAGFTYDEANRLAIIEPVCTHPDHRRRGLASTMLGIGLERAVRLGARTAVVGTGTDDTANRLYARAGLDRVRRGRWWRLVVDQD